MRKRGMKRYWRGKSPNKINCPFEHDVQHVADCSKFNVCENVVCEVDQVCHRKITCFPMVIYNLGIFKSVNILYEFIIFKNINFF